MSMSVNVAIALYNDGTDSNNYTFSAYTPTANTLQVAMIECAGGATGVLSHASIKWTLRAVALNGVSNRTLECWTANVDGSPGSIQPAYTKTGAPNGFSGTIWEVSGHDTANPVRQVIAAGPTTSTNPFVTFASALLTGNTYFAAYGCNNPAPGSLPPTGWTETADGGVDFSGMVNAYRVNGETGTTYTFTEASAFAWGSIGIEINADPGATAYPRRGVISG